MRKFLFNLCLIASISKADFIPFNEKCTFENDKFWIKVIELCSEGDIACDKVAYIGLNKKSGEFITLKGKAAKAFKYGGYEFANQGYTYLITRDDLLFIYKGDKLVQEMKLQRCEREPA